MVLSRIMKVFLAVLIILTAGLYFWYVQGVDIGPLLNKARSVRVSIRVEKVSDPLDSQDAAGGLWERLPAMPTARGEVVAGVLKDKIYVIGGIDGFGRSTDIVEVFDAKDKAWSSFASVPQKLHHALAVTLDNKLYVIGGLSGLNFNPLNKIWVLDEDGQEWKELADLPEAIGAGAAVAFAPGGNEGSSEARIYIFGGSTVGGLSEKTFAYSPAKNEWKVMKPIPTPREHLAAAAVGDKIYVVGGRERSLKRNLDVLEVFTPEKNVWTVGPAMPTKRSGIAAAAIGNSVYVFGGEYILGTNDEVERFDVEAKSWKTLNSMPSSRHGMGIAAIGNTIYTIGGGKHPVLSVSAVNEAFVPPDVLSNDDTVIAQ
jgi:N-acetylneuraminic acid mutarotase